SRGRSRRSPETTRSEAVFVQALRDGERPIYSPAMRNRPVGTILLCLVVVVSSFLPWGTMSVQRAVEDTPGLGEFAKTFATGFGLKAVEVNAWNSHVMAGSLRIPTWVVPVLAAFVGLSIWLRAADVWTPPRALCPLLAAAAAIVT